jgi:hypothetical protein
MKKKSFEASQGNLLLKHAFLTNVNQFKRLTVFDVPLILLGNGKENIGLGKVMNLYEGNSTLLV